MPKTINGNPAAALNLAMLEIPLPNEDADATKYEAHQKQHLDNAGALQTQHNALTTRVSAVEAVDITENSRLNAVEAANASDNSRLSAAEAANSAEEARLAVLEAQGVNDPLKRFQWSVSGGYPTPTLTAALAPTFGFGIGSTTVILPVGKVLRVKNVRYGVQSMTTPGGGGIGKFFVRNRSSGVLYFNTAGRDGQESPNYKIADNSAGGAPLEVYLTAGFFNDAAATGTISIVDTAGFWLDLSIE
jgi:hypothetical protein